MLYTENKLSFHASNEGLNPVSLLKKAVTMDIYSQRKEGNYAEHSELTHDCQSDRKKWLRKKEKIL